ncbi:MAG: F0F1 ATP synthase subunit B [Sneathiella sp.]|jgi:F-type H+-transporting ATPase subunit b|uniref:F0F1 ATP synthase subunit B family protein n=1 Tax=Sneathiella sp. TaxID=1964365 RepID=UPI000C634664|nr:ATP F0F1 synthase subunit B [Sneathiella sp.]MAL78611.1 F0F1 ATP synthase subunit B [Sneathiella sp.]|tara:strand:- start:233 stop:718 length:486 start_codon:yes stop_codon:yes gene_type:complete
MLQDPSFWVAVAFFAFLAVLVYYKVPPLIVRQLDARADKIRAELDEAKRLREEAQVLFADYQRRQHEAMQTAEDIVAKAKEDAEILRAQSVKELEIALARRQEMAEAKIRQAEEKAVAEVQGIAVDVAIAAASKLMQDGMKADKANALIDQSIKDLQTHLN